MIIVMKPKTPAIEIQRISEEINGWNIIAEKSIGKHQVVIGLIGDTTELEPSRVQALSSFIEQVVPIERAFKRVSREFRNGEPSVVAVPTPNGVVQFGQDFPVVHIAGPCSVESESMIIATAQKLKQVGAKFLRGGAYKPRTSPYAFQGHGESALDFLATAREQTGLGIITEVMNVADLEKVAQVADIIQIGARNMHNYSLLKKAGSQSKPIFLKRGMCATIQEWLLAAEYIIAAGNSNIILCERGIRSFDSQFTRNTLDLSVIPVLRTLTHLPIAIDPSHGTGRSEYVPAMAKAAIAAGADSLMIEVHPNPAQALSDGPQSLNPEQYQDLMAEMIQVSQASDCRTKLTPQSAVLTAV
ncbi:MAG: 3-deoxy-7-phosphoheptulonate synthase [Pleurocapsa sp. SU_5_0]|nr:3-deoxy-7-phosphoheptulonate synthase [Pleurocapsa sp. SU_5_0]NJR45088.1 3-deoxy-7-phosphoheptulonate synthase [Hyellaceae cyanobacterium CSU_1_1]